MKSIQNYRSAEWYNKRMKTIEYKKGLLIPKEQKPKRTYSNRYPKSWYEYKNEVWKLTRLLPLELLNNFHLRSFNGHQLDHIVSVWDGYKNNIPTYLIASMGNVRIITKGENGKKGIKSVPDKLNFMLDMIRNVGN